MIIHDKLLLLMLNESGNVPTSYEYARVAFLLGCLIDLMKSGNIKIEKKKVEVLNPELGEDLEDLSSLMDVLNEGKPKSLSSLSTIYIKSFSVKKFNMLVEDVRDELLHQGCLHTEVRAGTFSEKLTYIKDDAYIEKLTSDIYQSTISLSDEQALMIVMLLNKSLLIKRFYTKEEVKALRRLLKENADKEMIRNMNHMISVLDDLFIYVTTMSTVL